MKRTMKKFLVIMLILSCTSVMPVTAASNENRVDIEPRGNVLTYIHTEVVYFTEVFVECNFMLTYDERTGQLYDVSLISYVPQGDMGSYYIRDVYLTTKNSVDYYTYEVTVAADIYVTLGGSYDTNTRKVYLTTP